MSAARIITDGYDHDTLLVIFPDASGRLLLDTDFWTAEGSLHLSRRTIPDPDPYYIKPISIVEKGP